MTRRSLQVEAPGVARQWHPTRNDGLRPCDVSAGSKRKVWWRCKAGEDHVWQATVYDRTRGIGCPYCAGVRVSATNSLAANVSTAVLREWHPTLNGAMGPSMVGAGSNKKYWWRCSKGHVWQTAARNRALYGTGCPRCVKKGGKVLATGRRPRRHAPSHSSRAVKRKTVAAHRPGRG